MSTAPVFGAEHPLLAALGAARNELAAATDCGSWSLSEAQVVSALDELFALRAQVEFLTATQVHEADTRGLAVQLNQSGTPRWLRRRFLLSRREAERLHTLAGSLPAWPATGRALAAGTIGVEQAGAITRVLHELPPTASTADRDRAQALLIDQAATLEPEELTRAGVALREVLTDTPDTDDPVEAAMFAAQAEADAARRQDAQMLRLRRRGDGMTRLDGLLAPLTAAAVRAALATRAARLPADDDVNDPRSRDRRMADALHDLALTGFGADAAQTGAGTSTGLRPVAGPQPTLTLGTEAPRTGSEDAADTAETTDDGDRTDHDSTGAARGDSTGADAPPGRGMAGSGVAPAQVTLTVKWETLQALRPRAGILDDATPLAPSEVLTALCDAAVLPAVFAGAARPIRLGRRRRTFTPTQRAGLAARDRGCTFPGCTRPAAATAAHHLVHWAHGGTTDIDNGALLCPYHHALVHREGWHGQLARNGHVEYVPPRAFDPQRRPRQHLRYRGNT